MPCLRAGGNELAIFAHGGALLKRGLNQCRLQEASSLEGDSLRQTHAGMFRAYAQRDRLEIFCDANMQRPSLGAGRSDAATFTARRAPSSKDLHWMQSSPVGRPSRPSLVPASLIEGLRCAQSSTYTVTLLLCMASLYGDPRSAQTSPGPGLAVL